MLRPGPSAMASMAGTALLTGGLLTGGLLTGALLAGALLPGAGPAPRDGDQPGGPGRGVPPRVAESVSAPASPYRGPEGEAGQRALERSLDWLAARQAETPHGGFPAAGATQHAPVAMTALAALAFMAGGSTPERGPHGARVRAAIDHLLERVDLDPSSPTVGYVSQEGDGLSRMHGHGYATLALAEAYAVSPRTSLGRRIERALPLAVDCIERSQGREGGWEYHPYPTVEHENSVTITLIQALRAARNAGVRVDPKVISRALDYVVRTQKDDGSFRYGLGNELTTVAISAASVATLNAGGRYSGAPLAQGYDYLLRELELRELSGAGGASFPCYERLYLAQALWQHSDPGVFERWFAAERRRLILSQDENGSWTSAPEQAYGRVYATAVNALVLALPDGLLPIFQR